MQYSLVSTPAVLDLDADGFADVVYIGDLAGNLFKWVIKPIGEDRANDASSLRTQPNWKFQHFFQAPVDTVSGDNYYKNVFQPPAAAYVGTKLWIAFGTGERAAIGYKGLPTHSDAEGEENRFYGITDPDPLALSATAPAVLTEAGLTNITTVGTPVTSPRGYYFTVVDGEKFVTTTVIFAGKVITASFTPSQLQFGDPGFDPCTQRGNGNLYIFDLASGTGEFTDGGGDESRFTDIGSGLPTDPKISIGVGGDDNKIVIQKSGTDIQIFDADDVDFGRGIIYWREMH
jgi:Tfp pilus tip-associated adhesin PilY1